MARAGRSFEKLIATLESALLPHGAEIRSPDYIRDKVTEQPREVDVSIRYKIGSTPILVTLECRDRIKIEDKTWIEQLAQKRNDIGANATVAVSSSGFSKPAIRAAEHHGIEVRTLSEVDDDAIAAWAQSIELTVMSLQFAIGPFRVGLRRTPVDPAPSPHRDVIERLGLGVVETPIMRRCVDGNDVSLADLLAADEARLGNPPVETSTDSRTYSVPPRSTAVVELSSRFRSLLCDVPMTGEVVTKVRSWEFPEGEFEMQTEAGFADVAVIEVEFAMRYFEREPDLGSLLAYADPRKRVLAVRQERIEIGSGKFRTIVISSIEGNDDG